MAVWSRLVGKLGPAILKNDSTKTNIVKNVNFSLSAISRSGDHGPKLMPMQPTRWQWHKFKDMLHYYTLVGALPVLAVLGYCNIFIGPAQLEPIPEGYTPQHWEYSRHPLTRFLARYVYSSRQQEYEKFMHFIYEEKEKMMIRKLENDIRQKMFDRKDFQSYYYRPYTAKYIRAYKKSQEELVEGLGD